MNSVHHCDRWSVECRLRQGNGRRARNGIRRSGRPRAADGSRLREGAAMRRRTRAAKEVRRVRTGESNPPDRASTLAAPHGPLGPESDKYSRANTPWHRFATSPFPQTGVDTGLAPDDGRGEPCRVRPTAGVGKGPGGPPPAAAKAVRTARGPAWPCAPPAASAHRGSAAPRGRGPTPPPPDAGSASHPSPATPPRRSPASARTPARPLAVRQPAGAAGYGPPAARRRTCATAPHCHR
jgi:hypothetical protein